VSASVRITKNHSALAIFRKFNFLKRAVQFTKNKGTPSPPQKKETCHLVSPIMHTEYSSSTSGSVRKKKKSFGMGNFSEMQFPKRTVQFPKNKAIPPPPPKKKKLDPRSLPPCHPGFHFLVLGLR